MTIIDDDITPPEEPIKTAKAKKVALGGPAADLYKALKFVSLAQKKQGSAVITHSFMSNGYLAATDGVLTIATPIAENLQACPHTFLLMAALSKCTEVMSIAQVSTEAISIKSGALTFMVPCCHPNEVSISPPDNVWGTIDNRIREAFVAVAGLAVAGAQSAVHASVLLQAGSAVANNGGALLEYWHGIDLPPGLMLPKASALAVAKSTKTLTGFGYSQSSVTFWYEDGSFIRTALYNDKYPEYSQVFDNTLQLYEVPSEFFKAIKIVAAMNKEGRVYFKDGFVMSSDDNTIASTYQMNGLPEGLAFSAAYLLKLENAFKFAAFTNGKVQCQGDNVRGVCMALDTSKSAPSKPNVNPYNNQRAADMADFDAYDDDIPF